MFVFKAAVVGAGTMGGQIAQTIAAAGFPVLLKDVDEALVQAGLDEARNVTEGQMSKLAEMTATSLKGLLDRRETSCVADPAGSVPSLDGRPETHHGRDRRHALRVCAGTHGGQLKGV